MSRPGPTRHRHLLPPPDEDGDYREPPRPLINRSAWLREDEAQRFIGRSRTTLYQWRCAGWVRAEKRLDPTTGRARWWYSPGTLQRIALREAQRRKGSQRRVAGPGRGRAHTPETLTAARARAETRALCQETNRAGSPQD